MKSVILTAVAILLLPACTLQKKEGYALVDASDDPDLVCERFDIVGKVYPGKICMTEKQWARHAEAGSEAVSSIQRKALSTSNMPGPGGGT